MDTGNNNNNSSAESDGADSAFERRSRRNMTRSASTVTIRRQSKYNLRSRNNDTGLDDVVGDEPEPVIATRNCALKCECKPTPVTKCVTSSNSSRIGNWSGDAGVDFVMTRNLNDMTMMASLVVAIPFVLYGIINALGLFLDLFYWCTWMWTIVFSLAFYFNDITTKSAKRTKDVFHGILLFILFFIQYSDSAETVTGRGWSKPKVTQVPGEHDVEIVEITSGDQPEGIQQTQEENEAV